MPAPKGNTNGAAAWVGQFAPAEEKKVQVGVKVPVSMAELLDASLAPGETRGEFLRRAIATELERRKKSEVGQAPETS